MKADRLICPECGNVGDVVKDSRASADRRVIRRRRECKNCGTRYSTLEKIVIFRPKKLTPHNL